jgi:beta-lactamase superfamily II metal-dependent hydrolase
MIVASLASMSSADETNSRLDIYFIDVEGGAATLIVTPAGESLLIDSGYPDNGFRDRDRILKVVREVAGRKALDHAAVTHWHLDHYGNHAALAAEIPIKNFWDRGIPDALTEDGQFAERAARYRAAAQNRSKALKAGDMLPLVQPQARPALTMQIVTSGGDVIANKGEPNPFAQEHQPQPDDPTDNAKSLSFLLRYGDFSFLCCGDLTWNVEAKLMTPNNPLGRIELFMVTHHGLDVSNNPVLVKAIDPIVTVMCNGPTKGGNPRTQQTLRQLSSLKAAYQLHRNVELKDEEQTPAEFIANSGPTDGCPGHYVKASVAPDGKSFIIEMSGSNRQRTIACRGRRS